MEIPSFIAFFMFMGGLIGMSIGMAASYDNHEEEFNDAFNDAFTAETNETFFRATADMKEHSQKSFIPYINHIERILGSGEWTLDEAQTSLSYRVARHENTYCTTVDVWAIVFGILLGAILGGILGFYVLDVDY